MNFVLKLWAKLPQTVRDWLQGPSKEMDRRQEKNDIESLFPPPSR